MNGEIQGTALLWRERGQWRLMLKAPDWVLGDLQRQMSEMTHPAGLFMTSSAHGENGWEFVAFSTWNGGIGGGEPLSGGKRIISLSTEKQWRENIARGYPSSKTQTEIENFFEPIRAAMFDEEVREDALTEMLEDVKDKLNHQAYAIEALQARLAAASMPTEIPCP